MKFVRSIVLFGALAAIAAAQMPTVNANGAVNGAGYTTPSPPGSLIVVFGTNMASKLQNASSTPLTMELQSKTDTVSVTIGGKPAPMYYVAQNQLSVLVPWELASQVPSGGTVKLPIVVTRNGNKSPVQDIPIGLYSPGIFSITADGKGAGWVIDNETGCIGQPTTMAIPGQKCIHPVKAGDDEFIYAVGLGPTDKTIADGAAPCPLTGGCPGYVARNTTTKPTILINGTAIPAGNLQFSGLAPQFVGVYQVNFKMPSGIPASNTTQLQIQIGGITSNTVTFATE